MARYSTRKFSVFTYKAAKIQIRISTSGTFSAEYLGHIHSDDNLETLQELLRHKIDSEGEPTNWQRALKVTFDNSTYSGITLRAANVLIGTRQDGVLVTRQWPEGITDVPTAVRESSMYGTETIRATLQKQGEIKFPIVGQYDRDYYLPYETSWEQGLSQLTTELGQYSTSFVHTIRYRKMEDAVQSLLLFADGVHRALQLLQEARGLAEED